MALTEIAAGADSFVIVIVNGDHETRVTHISPEARMVIARLVEGDAAGINTFRQGTPLYRRVGWKPMGGKDGPPFALAIGLPVQPLVEVLRSILEELESKASDAA